MIMLHEKTTKLKVLLSQTALEAVLLRGGQNTEWRQINQSPACCVLSEKSFEAAATKAEGGAGEGAAAGEGTGERKATQRQTC